MPQVDSHASVESAGSETASADDDSSGQCSDGATLTTTRTGPLQIEVETPRSLSELDPEEWIALIDAAADSLGLRGGEIFICVIDERGMEDLHERSFGSREVTDVITFDHLEGEPERRPAWIEADIAVCHDVARREAARRGHDLGRELLLYALHGMLHCLGFDDRTDEGFATMHRKEDETLEAIGVGRTFASDQAGPSVEERE